MNSTGDPLKSIPDSSLNTQVDPSRLVVSSLASPPARSDIMPLEVLVFFLFFFRGRGSYYQKTIGVSGLSEMLKVSVKQASVHIKHVVM